MQLIKYLIFSFLLIIITISCDRELSVSQPEPIPIKNKVVLQSDPIGYDIYLNEKITGKQMPDSLIYLEVGQHTIELKSKIFLDTSFTVDLAEGEIKDIYIDVESNDRFYGQLSCESNPSGCLIMIDDSSTNEYSPKTFQNIYPGNHKITYIKKGYRDGVVEAIVKSNITTSVHKALIDTTVWLVYHTNQTNIPTNYFNLLRLQPNSAGDVWAGTNNLGIVKLNDPIYTTYNKSNSDLSVFSINDLCFEYDKLFVATNEGLFILDETETWTHLTSNSIRIPNNSISSLFTVYSRSYLYDPAKPGTFIGTHGGGVSLINGSSTRHFTLQSGDLPSNDITSICAVGSGVAIGTSDNGVALSTRFNQLDFRTLNQSNSNIPGNEVFVVSLQSPTYTLWAGIDQSTIYAVFGALAYYIAGEWREIDINREQVYSIIHTIGTTWVGTSGGLIKIENGEIVEWYTTENTPMTSNFVYDILVDRTQRMWLATGDGILRVKVDVL